MASATDRDADLARLSGPNLVAHLRATCRSADYDAAASVLAARDRRLAEAEAAATRVQGGVASALAEVAALREKYEALRGAARHGPGSEAAHPVGAIAAPAPAPPGERRAEGVEAKGGDFIDLCSSDDDEADEECRTGLSGMSFKRKLLPSGDDEERLRAGAEVPGAPCNREPSAYPTSHDDNDDAIPLSQLIKKRRGAGPGAREPKTGMGAAQACSAGPLGIDVQKNYPVIREGGEAAAELRIGGSEEPKVGTFVQGNGNGKSKEDGAMPCPWRTGSTVRSSSPKNSSKVDEDKTNGGARVTKMLAETNGIEVQSGMILRAREQEKINGRVNKEKVLPEANGIREQGGKLSSVQTREVKGTVQLGTSDKPVSDNTVQLRASDKPVSACTFQLGTSDKLVSASLYSSPMSVDGIPKDQAVMINAHTPAAPLLDPIAVEGSNQRELQKKPANSESHSWLKSSLADGEHARIAGRGGSTAAALCALSCLKHVSVSSKVTKNLENGNSEMRSVPHGSSSTVATNVLTLKKCSLGVDDVRARSETRSGPKHALCKLTTTESSFEYGSSCTPSRALIFSPSSSKSNSIQGKGETSTLPSTVTRKSENDIFTSCLTNKEILLQAICALYRQRKFVTAPRGGGRTGNNGLKEHETHRVAKLAEFLLDGNLQGPLKRNVEKLLERDPTGLCFLEDVVLRCIPQLFDIYKNKEDPYFC